MNASVNPRAWLFAKDKGKLWLPPKRPPLFESARASVAHRYRFHLAREELQEKERETAVLDTLVLRTCAFAMCDAPRVPTLNQLLPTATFDPPELGDTMLYPNAVTIAIKEVATIKDGLHIKPDRRPPSCTPKNRTSRGWRR